MAIKVGSKVRVSLPGEDIDCLETVVVAQNKCPGYEVVVEFEGGWSEPDFGSKKYYYVPLSSLERIAEPNTVRIKKLHPDAQIPRYAKQDDVGADLIAVSVENETDLQITYDLGLAIETPPDVAALLFPRSSICKYDLQLSNSVGVGDPGFRGSYKAVFNKTKGSESKVYQVGERVCQLLLVPVLIVNFEEALELSSTERGAGGYGSSGK